MSAGMQKVSKGLLKKAARLSEKKFRRKESLALVEGVNLALDLVRGGVKIEAVLLDETRLDAPGVAELAKLAAGAGAGVFTVEAKDFKDICVSTTPQAAAAVAPAPIWEEAEVAGRTPLALVDEVRDPGNLGAIIRTAAALGAGAVFLSKGSADATSPKVVRGSMGAVFRIPFFEGLDLAEKVAELKGEGYEVYAADSHQGVDYRELDPSAKTAFVVGNEARGVGVEGSEYVRIPMAGGVESLNVAVALGVLLSRTVPQK